MSYPPEDKLTIMHRWFAAECNNRAWALTAKEQRTPEENRKMLLMANAAAHHWGEVGKPINDARADVLLAHVYSHIDAGEMALHCAERALKFFETYDEAKDWDVVIVHAEMAYACHIAGKREDSKKHYALSLAIIEKMTDIDDKKIVIEEVNRLAKIMNYEPVAE